MKRFLMLRDGSKVAEGVEFSDGTVVIRWTSGTASTEVWNSMADAVEVHTSVVSTGFVAIDGDLPDVATP